MTQLAKDVASSVREEADFDLLTTIGCADIDQGQAERAFETFTNRYAGLLKGMALNAGWDRYGVNSDILIQETFLKAWAKAGNFDPRKRYKDTPEESAVKLWLLAIFKNAFLDELRKLGRRQDRKLVEPQALDGERDDSVWRRVPAVRPAFLSCRRPSLRSSSKKAFLKIASSHNFTADSSGVSLYLFRGSKLPAFAQALRKVSWIRMSESTPYRSHPAFSAMPFNNPA